MKKNLNQDLEDDHKFLKTVLGSPQVDLSMLGNKFIWHFFTTFPGMRAWIARESLKLGNFSTTTNTLGVKQILKGG